MGFMRLDQSFGIIPIKKEGEEWLFLLVQHHAGHWAFPKGHPDPLERPEETATRELREETGLLVDSFWEGLVLEENYSFEWEGVTVLKRVAYFVAQVSGSLMPQPEEIRQACWCDANTALERLSFEESRRLCQAVIRRLD